MTRKKRRIILILFGAVTLALSATLVSVAMRDAIVFFVSPSELLEKPPTPERRLRIGGLVEEGSVERGQGKLIRFRVTDTAKSVPVVYDGILPDLFREGQGVVAEGQWRDGVFHAREILAKHDEKYIPREVVDSLKAQGQWKPDR